MGTTTAKDVNVNFKISGDFYFEITMIKARLKQIGKEMDLLTEIYPEVMQLGIEGFKKKYKL